MNKTYNLDYIKKMDLEDRIDMLNTKLQFCIEKLNKQKHIKYSPLNEPEILEQTVKLIYNLENLIYKEIDHVLPGKLKTHKEHKMTIKQKKLLNKIIKEEVSKILKENSYLKRKNIRDKFLQVFAEYENFMKQINPNESGLDSIVIKSFQTFMKNAGLVDEY